MPKARAWVVGGRVLGALALLAACNFAPQTGSGGGQGPVPTPTGSDAGKSSDAATGGGCTVQTTGGSMLCETISVCPGVTVNQATFNQCGFLIAGKAIDLECECSGYLCSAGTTTTCAAAELILKEQNSDAVCNQLSTGGCVFEVLSGGSGSGSGTSGCNEACASECVGDPTCTAACGC